MKIQIVTRIDLVFKFLKLNLSLGIQLMQLDRRERLRVLYFEANHVRKIQSFQLELEVGLVLDVVHKRETCNGEIQCIQVGWVVNILLVREIVNKNLVKEGFT